MSLIKDDRKVADIFTRIDNDAAMPESGSVLVTAERLEAEWEALASRADPVGVIWPNNRPVVDLAPYLSGLAVVALVFPIFRDGRAYTQARHLRERHGYAGELRATGNVLRDQFLMMHRAGFDAFEVTKPGDDDAFTEALRRYTMFYQPAVDGRQTVLRQRLHSRGIG
ncbi:oxidoreductase [Agaricicola taiwanensis]|uniref:Oxidoreductase n=1 Tax=Agaricicola taiwanensis TaxID=591372 RepID=A0A8J2VNG4_9RHOB|nr:DUF934 domain-containing protein [Agaricicola taiwanensis]GGE30650.1 oxidoreductase [Agaricicola taiwanensis]